MIALGPISVRIGRAYYRLNHGQQVPGEVESFWRKNKQIEPLLKVNAISEKDEKKEDGKGNKKSGNKVENPEIKLPGKSDNDIEEVKT